MSCHRTATASAGGQWHFDGNGHGNAITRDDIEQILNLSGAHLHRGSAKRVEAYDAAVTLAQ